MTECTTFQASTVVRFWSVCDLPQRTASYKVQQQGGRVRQEAQSELSPRSQRMREGWRLENLIIGGFSLLHTWGLWGALEALHAFSVRCIICFFRTLLGYHRGWSPRMAHGAFPVRASLTGRHTWLLELTFYSCHCEASAKGTR